MVSSSAKIATAPLCRQPFRTVEEKQTDVNMAIHLFRLAVPDAFDNLKLRMSEPISARTCLAD
jgi:hypothetical protein